ncbi:esterase-like activity of phytase family protein [Phytohabitans rumicis]|uniref:Glycerophosphoryl diester phosphodiesterase n=1 Tax=Phytohabitans rumicis TaxID=1076125 RepID=A0A6V8L089_9ACTN|nr:esterase-like activity of phytase family protein [Phytohabitans rumicis]GFJ88009.1 glycerophosphoryl diester phosphodiesterase [Phytohabitans rumicis]
MRQTSIRVGAIALALTVAATPAAATSHPDVRQPTLTGFASLPAQTYVPASEPSGAALGTAPINGVQPPFADQPVQGFSGILRAGAGTYEVLSDNGYGTKANSADFALRVQRIAPVFRTGAVDVLGGFNLTDPDGKVPFPLVRPDRVLTGQDFDVESIVRAVDGTYWFGDEFGPFLLHTDRAGRLLSAPVPLPDVRAPENPYLAGGTPNLPSSKGYEGMATSPDGRYLYPLLEGTVTGDPAGSLRLYEFDTRAGAYTGQRWVYRLDAPNHAIGDAIAVDANRFLIIERDGGQGDAALVKKIYLADRRDKDGDGALDKTLLVDLLNIANPRRLGGFGEVFRFPFVTIEDVLLLDERTIAVLNDNNYPSSSGRTPGQPDNNEFITIRLPQSLHPDPRALR